MGFWLVIFPGGTVRALTHTLQAYFASLKRHGTTAPFQSRMHDFSSLNRMLGTDAVLERRARLRRGGLMDPVTLAVLKGRLEGIADEMDATLFRGRVQPDHRRGARRLPRALRGQLRRHAGAGQVGPADLRRRHGLRRQGGDRQVPGRSGRRRVRLQRSLSGRHPPVGHAADPALHARWQGVLLAGQRRALARSGRRGAGQLQPRGDRVFPGSRADPAGAAVCGRGAAAGHTGHHPGRQPPARRGLWRHAGASIRAGFGRRPNGRAAGRVRRRHGGGGAARTAAARRGAAAGGIGRPAGRHLVAGGFPGQ